MAIARNNGDSFEVLVLCPAVEFSIANEINVTGKAFRLLCATSRFINEGPCRISGGESSRFFTGAPKSAIFQDIILTQGSAVNGGAINAVSRNWTFHDVAFVQNTALQQGGAIYVGNSGAKVTLFSKTTFRDNAANNGEGDDIYIASSTSASLNSRPPIQQTSNVRCEPTTLLRKPVFCDGPSGLVVTAGNSSFLQKAIHTNCFDLADFQC